MSDYIELTEDELDELTGDESEEDKAASEYFFSNPDPYAKPELNPNRASKHNYSFDESGNITVKNLSAFWLPDLTIHEQVGGTEYTVTGSYDGTETLDKKLSRIIENKISEKRTNEYPEDCNEKEQSS